MSSNRKIVISGIDPLSCNDYPKEMAFVIFLGGCNFRCPFCHNSSIVNKTTDEIPAQKVFEMLKSRKGFIDAVVVTGGEPTIYGRALINFLKEIKSLNFKIKLDTNGTNPELLKEIISLNLIDFIAMDIKNTFEKYELTSGVRVNISTIKKAMSLIEQSGIDYEFRSTINKTHHNKKDIQEITSYCKNKRKLSFQRYKYNKNQLVNNDFLEYEEEEMNELKDEFKVAVK